MTCQCGDKSSGSTDSCTITCLNWIYDVKAIDFDVIQYFSNLFFSNNLEDGAKQALRDTLEFPKCES